MFYSLQNSYSSVNSLYYF